MNKPNPGVTSRHFSPGQYIFREGDPSSSIFVIQKGTVAIRKRKGSDFIEIARIYPNEVLGELSFFDRQPRSAAAAALTEVEVIEIKFENLDRIYGTVPAYMKTIVTALADRLRKANDLIRRLQKQVVTESGEFGDETKDEPTASDILAATSSIGMDGAPAPEDSVPESTEPGKPDEPQE